MQINLIPSVGNSLSSTSMGALDSWISNCQKHHTSCRREGAKPSHLRFARILDVSCKQDSPDVRLCRSDQLPDDAEYMTLSHCWGGAASQIPSLVKGTYEQYMHQISVASLPRTFQDTIRLARHLRIQYLWIDSLCIVQDSERDWLEQAALMGEIYRGSYLNVAATKSPDPHGGLFTTRNPILITPLRIALRGIVPKDVLVEKDGHERPLGLRLQEGSILVAQSNSAQMSSAGEPESYLDLNTCLVMTTACSTPVV